MARMTTFIGNISALQFLVSNGTPQRRALGSGAMPKLLPTRAAPRIGVPPKRDRICEFGQPEGIFTNKLHVNVADEESRRNSESIACHIWTGPDRGTYLRIDDEYCVLTPEACFAQMAGELPLAQLVELAMMLCGTYAPAPEGLPTRYDMEPLTTPKELRSYVARLSGKRGLDNARIAARLATSGSGSLMESKIASDLALSTRHGGRGVPAELNVELALTDEARGLGYRSVRRPDFLWPRYRLAMDYDSREFHDERAQAEADEMRRNELSAMGLNSIIARPRHFRDPLTLEALMGQLFAAMPRTQKSAVRNLSDRRMRVYRQLYGAEQWKPMDVR